MEDCVSVIFHKLVNPRLHVTGGETNMSPIYYLLTTCRVWYVAGKSIIKDNKYSWDDYLAFLVSETGYDDEVTFRTLVKSRRTDLMYKDDMVVYYACEFDYPDVIVWNGVIDSLLCHEYISTECIRSLLAITSNKYHKYSLMGKMIFAERKDACDIIFATGITGYSFKPKKLSEAVFVVENGYCNPADIVSRYYFKNRDIIEYFLSLEVTVEIYNSNLELSKWMLDNGCPFSERIWRPAIKGGLEYMEWLDNIIPYHPDNFDLLRAYETKSAEVVDWLKRRGCKDNRYTVAAAIENDMILNDDAPLPAFNTLNYKLYKYLRDLDIGSNGIGTTGIADTIMNADYTGWWIGTDLDEFIEAYNWLDGRIKLRVSIYTNLEILTWILHNDNKNAIIIKGSKERILRYGNIELYDKWVAKYEPIEKLSYHRHLRRHQLSLAS
jgi:hypothetical protein